MRSDAGQAAIEYAALLVLAAGTVFLIGGAVVDHLPSEVCTVFEQADCETKPEERRGSPQQAFEAGDGGPAAPPRDPESRERAHPGTPPRPPRDPDSAKRVHPIAERLNAMIEKYEDLHYDGQGPDPSIRDLDGFLSEVVSELDECAAEGPGSGSVVCAIPPEGESLPPFFREDWQDVYQLATDLWYYAVRSGLIVENEDSWPRWQPEHCSPHCLPTHFDPSHTVSATVLGGLAEHPDMTDHVHAVITDVLGNVVNGRLPQVPPGCRLPRC